MAKRQAESDSTSDLKTTTTYMSVSLPSQNTIPAARTPTPSSTSSTSSSLAADGSTGVVNNGANPPRDIASDQNGNVVPPPETPAAPSSDAYSTYSRASPVAFVWTKAAGTSATDPTPAPSTVSKTPRKPTESPPVAIISSTGFSRTVVIGATIRAALGTLLVGLIALLLYKRHKGRHQKPDPAVTDSPASNWVPSEKLLFGWWGSQRRKEAAEMADTSRQEPADTGRIEMEGEKMAHELPT